MDIVCLDLEGVLVPEIWVRVADSTGIEALSATTRDVPDYDALMRQRLGLLDENKIGLADIQAAIAEMGPIEGAEGFLEALRERAQVVILSDTYYEFALPLMRRLGWPTLFCHRLETDGNGAITGYRLRMPDHKRGAVSAFRQLNFRVTAVGDSYNDTGMLAESDAGILFRAPENVIRDFPDFPVVETYPDLLEAIAEAENR